MALPLLVASARPGHHCMASELVLKCFMCESKQAVTFNSQFSKVMFWRATRKHTWRSNSRGKNYPLKEKKAKQSKKHKLCLITSHAATCLPFALPAFGFTYLVPPANPIWCRRLWGGFDILRVPTIFSNLSHIHHCWHHGVNGGQVCSVQTVWWTWWYLVAV